MMKKFLLPALAIFGAICLSFFSCSKDSDDKTVVTDITLSETSISLKKGNETTITYTIVPSNATENQISWSSNNTEIATVNNDGKVTGISLGAATITATAQTGVSDACDVAVYDETETQRLKWKGITKDISLTFFPALDPSLQVVVLYNENDEFVKTVISDGSAFSVPENGSMKSTKPILENIALIENTELTYLDCSNNSMQNLLFHNNVTTLICDNCPDLEIVNIDGSTAINDVPTEVLNTLKVIQDIIIVVNNIHYIYNGTDWVEDIQP